MSDFSWILSKDEKSVIIFGGYAEATRMKDIRIINLNNMQIYRSKLKIPSNLTVQVISMSECENSAVLISGYIRRISKEFNLDIPLELLSLFQVYFESEIVYLICNDYPAPVFYSIPLNDILRDKTND